MWVRLTELNDRLCLGVRFTWSEVMGASDGGNYNFSRQEDVKDPEFGTWGSAFRFDLTARNVCDPAVKGGADVYYMPDVNGEYEQVTVQDEVISWMWSEPVYYWGFGSRNAEEDTYDPTPYAADYIYVLVDDDNEGTEDGGITDVVTLADNLNRLIQAKADIKSAIENKGVSVGDITIDGYAAKIAEIPQEGGGSSAKIRLADTGIKLGTSTFSEVPDCLNFDGVTSLSKMFYACTKLTSLDASDWDVSECDSCSNMLYGCERLTSADLSGWNLKEGVSISNMFDYCNNLTTLNLSGWDLSKVSGQLSIYDTSIKNLTFGYNHKSTLDLTRMHDITVSSLLSVLEGLYDFTGNNVKPSSVQGELWLGVTNTAKLSDSQIAIATDKGWTIS